MDGDRHAYGHQAAGKEAAALAAFYTLLLGIGASLGILSLYAAFRQAEVEAAAIGLLIGTAGPFAFLLAV
ncbi:hypothetical protein AB9F41_35730, partial [Rhizobium leguminosarum]|uniref:hypothetical protein n=1 Tax=Rhizobium leguminosarum TaxID=384 RepID=UPI003F9CA510